MLYFCSPLKEGVCCIIVVARFILDVPLIETGYFFSAHLMSANFRQKILATLRTVVMLGDYFETLRGSERSCRILDCSPFAAVPYKPFSSIKSIIDERSSYKPIMHSVYCILAVLLIKEFDHCIFVEVSVYCPSVVDYDVVIRDHSETLKASFGYAYLNVTADGFSWDPIEANHSVELMTIWSNFAKTRKLGPPTTGAGL